MFQDVLKWMSNEVGKEEMSVCTERQIVQETIEDIVLHSINRPVHEVSYYNNYLILIQHNQGTYLHAC